MLPKYKLMYFNSKGFAEPSRLIFAQAGVEYEDVRFEREEWPKYQPLTPTGKVPALEVDGVVYAQSTAIARYLARQFGLSGTCALDELRADMIVDTLLDMLKPLMAVFGEEDEAKKAELIKKFQDEQLPGFLVNLEKMLVANKGGEGYFVGDEVTWADLCFIHFIAGPSSMGIKVDWSKTPKLLALNDRVTKLPRIAEWLEKRPKTER